MAGVFESVKAAKKQLDDRSICMDLLGGAKAATTGYFMAVLESPTPELRSMFRGALSQTVDEYSALMDLALNRGWMNPYDVSEQLLGNAYKESQTVISYQKE